VSGDYQARFCEKVPGKFRRLTLQKPRAEGEDQAEEMENGSASEESGKKKPKLAVAKS